MTWRISLLLGITLGVVVWVFSFPTIPQNPAYHLFADTRSIFGIPNFNDVISNLPFLVSGIWGLTLLINRHPRAAFQEGREKLPFIFFFLAIGMVCLGSSCYHLHPQNRTLLWDRLPMSVAFMGILAATVSDRAGSRAGVLCLGPMVAIGLWSVLHWYFGEMRGAGDLRLYALVQFFTLAAIPLLMILFPARYTHSGWLIAAGIAYGLAKILEEFDRVIFESAGISGHTFKHLAAASAAFCIIAMIKQRKLPAKEITN
jgi:hypothetical protein